MEPGDIKTRRSLLSRLRHRDDQESWQEFFDTYWKLIYCVAIKAGLDDQEAEDVVQETVLTVVDKLPGYVYDPAKCSFKSWLMHLTQWRIIDQVRKRPPGYRARAARRQNSTARTPTVERVPDPGFSLETLWEEEWQKNLMDAAMERVKRRVKADHYQMFYLMAVKGVSAREVAHLLGVSTANVYVTRHRIAALIRKEVQALEQRADKNRI